MCRRDQTPGLETKRTDKASVWVRVTVVGNGGGEKRTLIAVSAAGGLTIGQRRAVVEIPKKKRQKRCPHFNDVVPSDKPPLR